MILKKILIFFLFTCPCLSLSADQIAVFYALEKDYEVLASGANSTKSPVRVGNRSIQRLSIGQHSIIAVKMGSGAVETALSAQALLTKYRCDWAISLGPVGAISDGRKIGEWVLVKEMIAYDRGSETEEGFVLKKSEIAQSAQASLPNLPEVWKELPLVIVASGEKFYASDAARRELQSRTQAEVVDMNLAGLLPTCEDHHLAILNWRIVSDYGNKDASKDFQKFIASYDGAGGKIVGEWIATLPISPDLPEAYENLRELLGK